MVGERVGGVTAGLSPTHSIASSCRDWIPPFFILPSALPLFRPPLVTPEQLEGGSAAKADPRPPRLREGRLILWGLLEASPPTLSVRRHARKMLLYCKIVTRLPQKLSPQRAMIANHPILTRGVPRPLRGGRRAPLHASTAVRANPFGAFWPPVCDDFFTNDLLGAGEPSAIVPAVIAHCSRPNADLPPKGPVAQGACAASLPRVDQRSARPMPVAGKLKKPSLEAFLHTRQPRIPQRGLGHFPPPQNKTPLLARNLLHRQAKLQGN